jgi:hypothetical protein
MKTPIQELFSDLESNHKELFNIHTQKGRDFVNNYSQYLQIEKDFLVDFFVYIRDNKPTGMIEEIVKEYLKNRSNV